MELPAPSHGRTVELCVPKLKRTLVTARKPSRSVDLPWEGTAGWVSQFPRLHIFTPAWGAGSSLGPQGLLRTVPEIRLPL